MSSESPATRRLFKGFQKREAHGLQKKIRFSPGALYLRLALESADYKREDIDLDSYYEALQPILDERGKLYIWYGIVMGSLYFSYLGVLKSFSIGGVELEPIIIKHFLLVLLAIVSLQLTFVLAKVARYTDLFTQLFNKSGGAKKQDLILRYPRVFMPLHFGSWMTGSPKLMYPKKSYPIRTVLFLTMLFPAILFVASFSLWLVGAISYQLWFENSPRLSGWSRYIVIAAWTVFIAGIFVPTVSIKRVTFWHVGLSTLLGRFSEKHPDRYPHYVRRVAEADERRGGTLFKK